MYSSYTYDPNFPFNSFLPQAIQNNSYSTKKHSDSLNCLINCANFRVTLHITQKPFNKKDNIFYVQKGEKFFPLFFYEIASNKVIEEMQKKNEGEKLLNKNKRIKNENEIFEEYEQNKKNKILLFNYIKFPLNNKNQENNENKLSTIIILDSVEDEIISNFSTNSSVVNQKNCSIFLEIRNTNNCDYLFSLSDIKDCKEIKVKLNGTVHEQNLFDKDILLYLSPELIEDSIRLRMEKYQNNNDSDNIEDLLDKFFFTKLNSSENNNIGILFSLKKKSETSKLKYDKEYLKSDRYLINKIFLLIDMWFNDNSQNSSTKSTSNVINRFEEKNNHKNKINFDPNPFEYNYHNNFDNNTYDYRPFYSNYNNSNEINDSSTNIIFNDINKIYLKERKESFTDNISNKNINNNYVNNNNTNNNYFSYDSFFKPEVENYVNYYEKEPILNAFLLSFEATCNFDVKKERKLYNENNTSNSSNGNSMNSLYSLSEEQNKNIFTKKTLFIDMNEELSRKLFENFEEDKCISNYTIIKNMLEIKNNIDKNKIKFMDFFDLFHNANLPFLNIPFVTKRGKIITNCLSPSLSSMLLVLKIKNKKKRIIKSNCKKFAGFSTDTYENNKKLFKIEFEEIKHIRDRELLYIKMSKIKKIFSEANLKYKDILIKNSYFCVLWSIINNTKIKSSFLAYYSFDFKLVGILISKLNYNHWMTPFSYKLDNYHDYKNDYEKNVSNVKKMFEGLHIDKDDEHYEKYLKTDYYNYLKSNKNNNYMY